MIFKRQHYTNFAGSSLAFVTRVVHCGELRCIVGDCNNRGAGTETSGARMEAGNWDNLRCVLSMLSVGIRERLGQG